jgi:gas vesicle protein GvpL/GvpF
MSGRVYVYALIETAPGVRRIRGRRIEIVGVAGFQAAIERRAAAPPLSESSLIAQHAIVVSLARRAGAILPARFGALVDLAELARVLARRRRTLRASLDRVRHRQQMTIRIFGEEQALIAPQAGAASGTAYLQARLSTAKPVMTPLARALRASLEPIVEDERLDPPRGRVVMTMNHLIARGAVRRYRQAVARAAERAAAPDEIAVTGPWPPFAFAPELIQ